jgi:hypothetical protein
VPTQKKQTVQTFCVEIHFESRMFSIAKHIHNPKEDVKSELSKTHHLFVA